MRLLSYLNVKITKVQLQIATEHFTKCVTSTVSVLIHTGQSNINAEANDDGEYNLKGKDFMYVRGTGKRPFIRNSTFTQHCDETSLLYGQQMGFLF